MESLSRLRRQIRSAEDLKSVVKSMKAMAAASIGHYEQEVRNLTQYERALELGLQIVLGGKEERVQIVKPPLARPLGAVVFGSEQGMVGNFNGEIVEFALDHMEQLTVPRASRALIAVGRRVQIRLERAQQPIDLSVRMPTSIESIKPAMQQLMLLMEQWREEHEVDRIVLFHNAPRGGTQYEPQAVQLIPLDPAWLRRLQEAPWQSACLPTFDLPPEMLFSEIVREHLYLAVYRAFAASLAAENSSRLSSMEAAEGNIEERLGALQRAYHQARQQSITSELLDIVAGSEVAAEDEA